MIERILAIVILIFCTIGCEKDSISNPFVYNVAKHDLTPADTLQRLITSGVSITLSGLKDSYNITDQFSGKITLSNFADSGSIILNSPSEPAFYFDIYDENHNLVVSGGGGSGMTNDTISIGQSYVTGVFWSKETWTNIPLTLLSASAGKYLCEYKLTGNALFFNKRLYKWITITETGDQVLFAFINNNFTNVLTTNYDVRLFIRNRFSNKLTMHYQGESVADFGIVSLEQDTVFRHVYPLSPEVIISGKSDAVLFSIGMESNDSTCIYWAGRYSPPPLNLHGSYQMYIHIIFKEREVLLRDPISFP